MSEDTIGNISISGSGRTSGGKYDEVKISGSGDINGDLECNLLSVSGSAAVHGAVKARRVGVSGSARFDSDIEAEETRVSGSASFAGAARGGRMSFSGSGRIGKSAELREIEISGSAEIGGDCSAERFHADGSFRIKGLLNAETIEIGLGGRKSTAESIGGSSITVRPVRHGGGLLQTLFGFEPGVLETDTIEGDEIRLENTKANVVRGSRVAIGPGCEIGRVEYRVECRVDSGAKVGESKKAE